MTAKQIKMWTSQDVILAKVLNHVVCGWPQVTQEDPLKLFFNQEELSAQDGYLLWGNRVPVSTLGCSLVLQELHESHPGVSKIRELTRSFVWLPKI